MGRIIGLLLIFLLAIASMMGYFFLNEKIRAGNIKIANGLKQLAEGEKMLARGKVKLAHGEQELSHGKVVLNEVKMASFIGTASILPVSWVAVAVTGNKITDNKIAEGDRLVAAGRKKIKVGEQQLAAGKLELRRGIERLDQAKEIRTIFGIGAIFFTFLTIALTFFWRKSLFKSLKA